MRSIIQTPQVQNEIAVEVKSNFDIIGSGNTPIVESNMLLPYVQLGFLSKNEKYRFQKQALMEEVQGLIYADKSLVYCSFPIVNLVSCLTLKQLRDVARLHNEN